MIFTCIFLSDTYHLKTDSVLIANLDAEQHYTYITMYFVHEYTNEQGL